MTATMTMMTSSHRAATAALLLCVALAAGCVVYEPVEPGPARRGFDPCAEQLHELEGRLLRYYSVRKRLPASLAEIRSAGRTGTEPLFTCPVSGKPYVYRPEGIPLPGDSQRIILYDAEPCHDGGRWAVVIGRDSPSALPKTWVIQVPESTMRALLDQARPAPAPDPTT